MINWVTQNFLLIYAISFILCIISVIFTFAIMIAINSIQKDIRTMLKMQSYDFLKDHPEKQLKELIKDRYAYYRVRF